MADNPPITLDTTQGGGGGGGSDATAPPPLVAITQVTGADGQATLLTVAPSSISRPTITTTGSSQPSTTVTQQPQTTTAPAESQTPQSPNLGVLLPAIVAPVVFVLIVASVILFTCLHFRNKRRERLDSGEHGMPVETQPLNRKASNSFHLPSPLADNDRTHEGSLGIYEKRKSMGEEAAKRNTDIIGLYERPSANGPNAYNYDGEKYTNPRMPLPVASVGRDPPPQNRSPPGSRPPPQNRAPPGSRSSPRSHSPAQAQVPSKPKPKPSPPTQPATENSSWPLPADGPLPSPGSMHSNKTGRSSRPGSKKGGPQLPPMSTSEPFSMREALRPESDTYDLSTSAATSTTRVPPLPSQSSMTTTSGMNTPYDRRSRKRESDAISELSDRDRAHDDSDRLSVVSAISGR